MLFTKRRQIGPTFFDFDYLSESSERFLKEIRNQNFTSGTKVSEHIYTGHTNSGQIGTWKRDAALPQNSINLTNAARRLANLRETDWPLAQTIHGAGAASYGAASVLVRDWP